jgi:uncharacterized protein YkwD
MLAPTTTRDPSLNFTSTCRAALMLILAAAAPAHAQRQDLLVQLVNAYRAAPGSCGGRPAVAAPPLVAHAGLSRVKITPGVMLNHAVERAGYPVARAEAIAVSGAPDLQAALEVITRKHCKALLNPAFVAAGSSYSDGEWLLVLAQPAPPEVPRPRPDAASAGPQVLVAVNVARAEARNCGTAHFPAAPPLAWNDTLALAALAHSSDMAAQRYFNHQGKDGRAVSDRATAAGYRWRLVGENIAAGQDSSEEVVAGWLDSPGHCSNIMNPAFTEMGSAFAISGNPKSGRAYWTQVFATPREVPQ